jgi:hypothetical protein
MTQLLSLSPGTPDGVAGVVIVEVLVAVTEAEAPREALVALRREPINLKTAVAGLKLAHLPKIAVAFEHLHHSDRPQLPFVG